MIMKIISALWVSILIFAVIYFVLDRQMFYYGRSDFDIYSLLPLKVRPEYRPEFEGGFLLWDEYGFSLVGNGVKFRNSNIEVDDVVKYGFSDERLLVQIKDTKKNKYLVEFKKSKDTQSEHRLRVSIVNSNDDFISDNYKWIKIQDDEKYIKRMELFRNYTVFVIIALFLILIVKILRFRGFGNT